MTKKANTLLNKFTENINTNLSIYKNKSLELFTSDFTKNQIEKEYEKFLNTVSGMYYYDLLSEKDHSELYEAACEAYIVACKEYDKIKYDNK